MKIHCRRPVSVAWRHLPNFSSLSYLNKAGNLACLENFGALDDETRSSIDKTMLSLNQVKDLLNDHTLTDSQILEIRDVCHALTKLALECFYEQQDRKNLMTESRTKCTPSAKRGYPLR
jgi:hypothetical protein